MNESNEQNNQAPGIHVDISYEVKQQIINKFNGCTSSYEYDERIGVWRIQNAKLELFDIIYSPYLYSGEKFGKELYNNEINSEYIEVVDQNFTSLLNLNTTALLNNTRIKVLVVVAGKNELGSSMNFEIGVGQYIPSPVTDLKGVYCRKLNSVKSNNDGIVQEIYDGNITSWKVLGDIKKFWKSNNKNPVKALNYLLPEGLSCVTTLDVFSKLMHIVDFCGNIDFYIWMGGCVEQWLIWPEVACKPLEMAHIEFIQNSGASKKCTMTDVIKQFELYEGQGMFRSNVYLGTFHDMVEVAMPFFSEASNGVFTLDLFKG